MTPNVFTIWTIGHSTRTISEFMDLLLRYHIFETYTVRALKEEPRYLIKSNSTTTWPCARVRPSQKSVRTNGLDKSPVVAIGAPGLLALGPPEA